MALLAQLQLPAVLAQQLLVVAVHLLDGLADLVGNVLSGPGPTGLAYPTTCPPTAAQCLPNTPA